MYPVVALVDDIEPTLGASLHSVNDSLTTEYLSSSLSADIDISCICLFLLAIACIMSKSVDEVEVDKQKFSTD